MIYILDLFGTFIFALTGAMAAGQKKMDFFGGLVLAFLTAVGGGTVRDLLIGNIPVFWLKDVNYIFLTLLACISFFFFSGYFMKIVNIIKISDAIGLGVFTIIGIQKGLEAGLGWYFVILLGMMTGVMGGILRDIFSNREPLIFSKEIYAVASLSGGGLYFLLNATGLTRSVVIALTILFIIIFRLLAIKYDLKLWGIQK